MDTESAYNIWAGQYDTNENKTRDLEALALRELLGGRSFEHCLEIGCGTGKNTQFLAQKAKQVTAVDFSEEMLGKAREKIKSDNVRFIQADITSDWLFADRQYDLVTFSLVLEHVEDIAAIFKNLSKAVRPKGIVYVGELHPFKQYSGSKARFNTADGVNVVPCFTHNISDFTNAAKDNGFDIEFLNEHFDGARRENIPRILTLIFTRRPG